MRRTEIERLLPEVFRATVADGAPLGAVLDVMAQLHEPDEAVLAELDAYFDPARTEDRFVPLLARWVDLERLFVQSATGRTDTGEREPISTGHGRLRELISRAAFLSQWRGTRTGLIAFLETATGASGFTIDEQVPGEGGMHVGRPERGGNSHRHCPMLDGECPVAQYLHGRSSRACGSGLAS